MSVKAFLKYVEIQTKVASIFPFILGTLFAIYRYETVRWENVAWMLLSLLTLDMATTALNNYMDHKRAIKRHGYGYEVHNALGGGQLSENQGRWIILLLVLIAVSSGIVLALKTDILVLLIGMASFAVAILYSWGPLPISRTPLGEITSGMFMGFVIFFLAAYINIFELGFVVFQLNDFYFHFVVNVKEIVILFMASLPLVAGIANIMLANNICDIEDDIVNKRYTLPFYIGKEKALWVFAGVYGIAYFSWLLMIILHWIPLIGAIALLTAIPVFQSVKTFFKSQDKGKTFVLAVKSFVLISSAYVAIMVIAIAIKWFF
ncbi:MAG: 1,4-dihydroxy-2-naphthoate polyprenyltransferase [Tissierellales bacterium]|nr:1,4-dihydroxy-2-naphthoate polyprenyltransferase [Tissierellales bacterium]